jgi:hypothetical protein
MVCEFSVASSIFNLINRNKLLLGKLKKQPNQCQDTLGNEPKSFWRPFKQNLKGIGDYLGNAQRGWRPIQQCLQNSGDTLGNAQTKVKTPWVHFPPGLQPIGNKETFLA